MTQPQVRTLVFQPEERNVFFHILTACNLACRHCYINKEQHGTRMLAKETMFKWLELFYLPDKRTNLIFLGGEPTLHKDLPAAVQHARKLGYSSITIDTNGFLFHDLLEKLSPQDAVISFSLDGPSPEVNDPLRGEGVFDTCTRNLRRAVQMGFETSVIYTVSTRNIDALYLMPALLNSLGVRHFFIQVIGLRGQSAGEGANQLQLSPEQWLEIIPPIAAEAARLGLHVIYPKVFLDKDEPFSCAGHVAENYFIFPNGRVYLCPLCEDHPVHAYEIDHDDHLIKRQGFTEDRFFELAIPEGCVMNKILQGGTIHYTPSGAPAHRISCCLLKQELLPGPDR